MIEGALAHTTPAAHPKILHMLGIPASGKTTYLRDNPSPGAVLISFDAIMESLPEYRNDNRRVGAEKAFAKWESCARAIGYELLFRSIERKLDIMFDHSGSRPDHVRLLEELKLNHGYRIEIVALKIDEGLAVRRAATRDRHLPPEYIAQRKHVLDGLVPQYRAIADDYAEYVATETGLVRAQGPGEATPPDRRSTWSHRLGAGLA